MEEFEELAKKYSEISPPLNKERYKTFKKDFIFFHPKLKYIRRDDFDDGNIHVDIYDCKVNVRGPDDKIYCKKKNHRIRDEITRGCILLEISDHQHNNTPIYKIYQGFAKFIGLTDQDDDDVAALSEKSNFSAKASEDAFFHESRESARKIIEIEKENGKAAHLAAFRINNTVYFVAGSKNVHVIFRNKQDLLEQKLKGLHTEFGSIFLNIIGSMVRETQERFIDMLCNTGLLANFEIMLKRDQHIVDYDFSSGDSVARFLAFTGRRTYNDGYKEIFGKCLPVDVGIEYMKQLGFSTPRYKVHQFEDKNVLREVIKTVRSGNNSEGSVLYFMNRQNLRTIGLCKTKTIWYVFFRAIREKLKRKGNTFNQLIKERFRSIQGWLDVDDEEIKRWRIIAFHFHLYTYEKLRNIKDAKNRVNKLREGYADRVRDFMKDFKIPEDLDLAISEIKDKKLVYGNINNNNNNNEEEEEEEEEEENKNNNNGWKKKKKKKKKGGRAQQEEKYKREREKKKKKREEKRKLKEERDRKYADKNK